MIQANELRPNNWLMRADGVAIQITNVGRKGVNIGPDDFPVYFYYDRLAGIPLTPEILEKCGFKKTEPDIMGEIKNKLSINGLLIIEGKNNLFYCGGRQIDIGFIVIKCNYLHQLQNLYFALTGEELQYQP